MELRPDLRVEGFGSWAAFLASRREGFVGIGIFRDISLGRGWVVTPAFGGGAYRSRGGVELGNALEFRSTFEVGRELGGRYRATVAFGHYSNGGFGNKNPGSEILRGLILVPIGG